MKAEAFWSRVADLSSPTFLNQDRSLCQYLQTPTLGNLARGKCSLCVSGASYRNEIHQKWLRIDPGGSGYAVTDIQNTANFASYVAPGGARIPLAPLIVALYHDADPGLVLGARTAVSSADFAADFNFSQPEMATYFETSMAHPLTKKYVGWRACHSQCHGNPHGLAGSAVVRDQIRVRLSTYFLVTRTLPLRRVGLPDRVSGHWSELRQGQVLGQWDQVVPPLSQLQPLPAQLPLFSPS